MSGEEELTQGQQVEEWLKENREGNFLRDGAGFWNDKVVVGQAVRDCSKELSIEKNLVQRIVDGIKKRELESEDDADESNVLPEQQETKENPSSQPEPISKESTTSRTHGGGSAVVPGSIAVASIASRTQGGGGIDKPTRKDEGNNPADEFCQAVTTPTRQVVEHAPTSIPDRPAKRKNDNNSDNDSDEYYAPDDDDDDGDDDNLEDFVDVNEPEPQLENNSKESNKRKEKTFWDMSSSDDSVDDEVDKAQSQDKNSARKSGISSIAARKKEALKHWHLSSSDDDDDDYDDDEQNVNERKTPRRYSYTYNSNQKKATLKRRTPPRKKLRLSQKKKYDGRRKWSTEEAQAIKHGIRIYGIGHWAKIKDRFDDVLSMRTSGQIKDKYRTMKSKGEV